MTLAIACPVCGRDGVSSEACPNCRTDLGVLRMLHTLPEAPDVAEPKPVMGRAKAAWWGGAVACLIAGFGLGGLAFRPATPLVAEAPTPHPTAMTMPVVVTPSPVAPVEVGFRYRVRRGDSYWAIAQKLYGDGNWYTKIARANAAGSATRALQPGDTLLVPNLEEAPDERF